MLVVWAKVRPTGTTKDPETSVIRLDFCEALKGGLLMNYLAGCTIDKKNSHHERLIPKFQRHRCMRKKGKPNLNDVTVFALYDSILLMGVRARHVMDNTNFGEKVVKSLILPSPISLHS